MIESTAKIKKNEEKESMGSNWKSTLLNGGIQIAKAFVGAMVVGLGTEAGRSAYQRMVASRTSNGVSGSISPLRRVI